ncbi:PH domain-containing protein [Halalkalibacterium ligniniphilum]|uniref:PH domain-containing protein n=1 Tax=Halalkalibacterium ligniniphilum TaxID=1134413 RepID=UPI001F3084CA|nr:PH domain-containing protein [Halalkalibacterium ligniniphilum]
MVLWYRTSIKYIFHEKYLLIKGGPFKRRISYETISKVSPTTDKLTGFRITPSDKGIELSFESKTNMKFSLENKSTFLSELRKRCPNADISKDHEFKSLFLYRIPLTFLNFTTK